jgi:thiol-disulfide isomerase/thioredoxin
VSLAYGVVATPQAFLFDADRKLRYVGRIDDSEVKTVKSHDVRNALDALLAGKSVPVEETRTFGCSTKWSEKRKDAEQSLKQWNEEQVALESMGEAALEKLVANDTDQLLVVNVLATWCGPCVKELPKSRLDQPFISNENVPLLGAIAAPRTSIDFIRNVGFPR